MCQAHQSSQSASSVSAAGAGIQVKVDDMTCGHCAGVITKAIESEIPGAKVVASPEARLVSVEGADFAKVSAIITEAGYTPSPVTTHA
jgi:copper chaperone